VGRRHTDKKGKAYAWGKRTFLFVGPANNEEGETRVIRSGGIKVTPGHRGVREEFQMGTGQCPGSNESIWPRTFQIGEGG